jgi:charged multivesicular body protein 2A
MKSDRQLKLPQIQKIMQEFEKQSEIMDMKEEMMSDAIDDAMGDEADEEERFIFIQLNVRQYF